MLDTIGDTIVAHVVGDGVWGTGLELVPDLEIGGTDQDEDAIFGLLDRRMVLLPGGGVIVVDALGPEVLEYNGQGQLVRRFGRKGEGPGEYKDAALAAIEGGLLLVADARNAKMIVYDSLGALVTEWRDSHLLAQPMAVPYSIGRGGGFVVRSVTRIAPLYYYFGFAFLSASGDTLDVLPAPYLEKPGFRTGFAALQPQRIVEWHPQGYVVTAQSDVYAIEVLRPGGGVVRITRDWTPVKLHDEEWAVFEQMRAFMARRGPRYPPPEIPRVKPAISRILIARTGEIWAQRHTAAVQMGPQPEDIMAVGGARANPWLEPLLLDVFGVDGEFLGSVSGPPGVEVGAISGDTVWGVRSVAYDIPQLVRFVIAR
ncbi:MAG TPA: hypothetical protein VLH75_14960 [Longimicrobiales bacterium]|nr:hypothetical protein [Longimicrobiales bacterium]